MARAQSQSKHTKAPFLIDRNTPASIMVPRLMVLLSAAFLTVVGLVMVYSSTTVTSLSSGTFSMEFIKQVGFTVLGLGIAFLIVKFLQNDNLLVTFSYGFWIFCAILFIVMAATPLGVENYGARRWLNLGFATVQPAELMKIAIVLVVAEMSINFRKGQYTFEDICKKTVLYVFLPLCVVVGPNSAHLQSDLGSTAVMFVGIITVIALGGAEPKTILKILAGVAAVGVLMIMTQPYRVERVMSMMDPWVSADDESYQLIRSLKALAAGGFFGKGIGGSYESFLTFSQSDFIFAIVGAEMGFIGAFLVVAAFAVFGYGGFKIAGRARSDYHMIIAGGLTAMLVFQACLNIASVIGAGPTTGKPLPFMSAGGSSMISSMATLGFLLMISLCSDSARGAHQKRANNLHVVSSDSLRYESDYDGYAGRNGQRAAQGRGGITSAETQFWNRGTAMPSANSRRKSSRSGGYPSSPRGKDPSNDLDYLPRRNSRYR